MATQVADLTQANAHDLNKGQQPTICGLKCDAYVIIMQNMMAMRVKTEQHFREHDRHITVNVEQHFL